MIHLSNNMLKFVQIRISRLGLSMQFGMFGSAQAKRDRPGIDSSAGFREFVERNVEAESLGYHSTFLVEHHFTGQPGEMIL